MSLNVFASTKPFTALFCRLELSLQLRKRTKNNMNKNRCIKNSSYTEVYGASVRSCREFEVFSDYEKILKVVARADARAIKTHIL